MIVYQNHTRSVSQWTINTRNQILPGIFSLYLLKEQIKSDQLSCNKSYKLAQDNPIHESALVACLVNILHTHPAHKHGSGEWLTWDRTLLCRHSKSWYHCLEPSMQAGLCSWSYPWDNSEKMQQYQIQTTLLHLPF